MITFFVNDKTFTKGTDTLTRRDLGKAYCAFKATEKVHVLENDEVTYNVVNFTTWWRDDVNSDGFIEFNNEDYVILDVQPIGYRHGMKIEARLVK
jgi:hypothetical protein